VFDSGGRRGTCEPIRISEPVS